MSLLTSVALSWFKDIYIRAESQAVRAFTAFQPVFVLALGTGNPAQVSVLALAHEANHMLRERISMSACLLYTSPSPRD